jgi:hypothetical protein
MAVRAVIGLAVVLSAGWAWDDPEDEQDAQRCSWSQWGQSAAHDGAVCVAAQPAERELASVTFDPFVAQEMAETFGGLFVHYQVPLSDDADNVFMMAKAGAYISCDPPGSFEPFPCGLDNPQDSQIWTEKRFHWQDGQLVPQWTFESDWKPFPVYLFEPMFQPALAGDYLYIPGAGGTVWQVSKWLGIAYRRINPFATLDLDRYVVGGITTDDSGNVYWNVTHLDPETGDQRGFLVKASPDGAVRTFAYDTIPGAPAADDLCFTSFFTVFPRIPFPWPPPDHADGSPTLPPRSACGAQRPGANTTPAIGRDGTIFTVSAAAFNSSYSYVLALHPNLTLRWATSLRDQVFDGCGVLVPYGGTRACRIGAAFGVDPNTNLAPGLAVDDASSSAPVALPDGGVLFGANDAYNGGRGHLVKLDRHGDLAATYTFGWDVTPAIYEHDHTYSIILKDNFYRTGGPFYLTQLSNDLVPEWWYANTSTQSCARQPDGTIACSDESPDGATHPDGFEWCINAPAVDRDGTVYATSEDGYFYAIGQGGIEKARVFLNITLGAAYTPLSIDGRGRIYTLSNGALTVLGNE